MALGRYGQHARAPWRVVTACVIAVSATAQAQSPFEPVSSAPVTAEMRSTVLADEASGRAGGNRTNGKPASGHPDSDSHTTKTTSPAGKEGHGDIHEEPIQLDAGILYDDNVSRAWSGPDVLSDFSVGLRVQTARFFPLDTRTRAMLAGSVGVDVFNRFDGLDRVFGALRAEFQYRPSAAFFAPTWALFGRVLGEHYDSNLRRGWRYSVGAYVMQPLTDRIEVLATVAHNERDANSAVFDGRENSAQISLDYALGAKQTFYVSGDFRRGDIVSDGQASLAAIDIAKVFAPDNAFPGKNLFAYRLEAKTTIVTVGYNYALSEEHALDISWRRSVAKSVDTPTFRGASPTRYEVNQYSVSFLRRF